FDGVDLVGGNSHFKLGWIGAVAPERFCGHTLLTISSARTLLPYKRRFGLFRRTCSVVGGCPNGSFAGAIRTDERAGSGGRSPPRSLAPAPVAEGYLDPLQDYVVDFETFSECHLSFAASLP